MQTTLQAKILQHLNAKKKEQGFTLIELLVVIIIIGILSAVALPTFLNQAGKARQAGAESIIGAVNRAQQAYRVENGGFAGDYDALEVGYTAAPSADGYTFGALTGNQDSASVEAASDNTDDQPSLCGTANTNTTGITEGTC